MRGDEFYIDAFFRLSSCRSFSGGAIGPVPWHRIIQYGSRKGLDHVMMGVFENVIWELDGMYRGWHQDQHNKQTKR